MTTQTSTPPPSLSPTQAASGSRAGWLFFLALVVGGTGVAWWVMHERKHKPGAHAAGLKHGHEALLANTGPLRLEVCHPHKGGITRTSTQAGSVHWFESAQLYAKISGYLKELPVDIGDRVKEGQVLAVIDNPEVVEDADRAAAVLAQAKAAVAQAAARVKTAEADLKASEATVLKARADIDRYSSTRRYREKELSRFKGLLAQQAVQQMIVDEQEEHLESAIAAEHSAQAEVVTSQAKVVSAQAMVEQAKADLAEAKANVEVADSNLARAKVFVDYTRIVSPYSGSITFRGFHRGDFIRSADGGGAEKPILTVARTDKVRVVTYIPDRDVPFTNVGDKARTTLDALPGEVFEGTVTRFAETEDPQSRTMRTEIDLANPVDRLREGMYGVATIILDDALQNLTLPTSCLSGKDGPGRASVFVLRDGRVHLTPVKLGADDGLRVEILSNLEPGDNVVLNPGQVADGVAAEAIVKADAKGG